MSAPELVLSSDASFDRYTSQTVLRPKDGLELERLLGVHGRLRCEPEDSDIGVETDLEAVSVWLANKATYASQDTVDAYRRESERLFMWLFNERGIALSDMRTQDFDAYSEFLLNPEPADQWIRAADAQHVRRGDPRWRIFKKPMNKKNSAYAFTIINHMLNWLTAHGHLRRNPISADKERRQPPSKKQKTGRAISHAAIQAVFAYIDALPEETLRDKRDKARRRYLIRLIYGMGLRVGDIGHSDNSMRDFEQLLVKDTHRWFWTGLSKGGNDDPIPCEEIMFEVALYRQAMDLYPALPTSTDSAPGMVLNLTGSKAIGEDRIYRLVCETFRATALWVISSGYEGLESSDIHCLSTATTHWLRHSNITHRLESGTPLPLVQRLARHNDPKTTMTYNTADLAQLSDVGALKP